MQNDAAASSSTVAAGMTAAATGAVAGNTTKPVDANSVTGAAGGGAGVTVVERAPRSRFTTVADLDRAASEQASRARLAEQRWQAIAALVTLALLVAGGYLLFKRPTVDELHGRIEAAQTMAASGGDLRDALPDIEQFLQRFPDDPRAGQVRSLERSLALDALEKRARRRPLGGRTPSPLERDYRAAMEREPESPSACRDALEALIAEQPATAAKLMTAVAQRLAERLRDSGHKLRIYSQLVQSMQEEIDALMPTPDTRPR